ncbi:MAG TPA: hypothetical protein VIH29_07065 [Gallionella sp.]
MMSFDQKTELLLNQLKDKHAEFEVLIARYRLAITDFERSTQGDMYTYPPEYWILVIRCDALVKLRIMLESNFNYIETLSLLATTRYIFELSIWLKAIRMNRQYAIFYVYKLIDGAEEHNGDFLKQVKSEIELLRYFAAREDHLQNDITKTLTAQKASPAEIVSARKRISNQIDEEANRKFCVYYEEAKVRGYGLQANLVEEQILPHAIREHLDSKSSKEKYEKQWDQVLKATTKRWNWKDMAEKVGLKDEYEYIYSYTSRLLHAKPSSLTTNQKSLESPEVYIFLRYSLGKISEIIEECNADPLQSRLH